METKAIKSVWAVKEPTGEIKVFSPLCPHLGCGYRWDNDKGKFACPCHGSVYSITGQVLAGPAPRPLDDLPEKIENGRLLVIYKEFKSGLPKKVEILDCPRLRRCRRFHYKVGAQARSLP